MNNKAWYIQPQFEDFWKHYHRSCLWLQMNGIKPILFFEENSLFIDNQANNLDKDDTKYDDENIVEDQIDDDDDAYAAVDDDDDDDDDNDDDDEIDPDYLNFIKETRRHQKERDEMKALLKQQEETQVIFKDVSEMDLLRLNKLSQVPSQEEDKSEEHNDQLDYGKRTLEIKSKESLLLNIFNKFWDEHRPNFWPTIPINIR